MSFVCWAACWGALGPLLVQTARADPFHRQTLPLGQRAVGMGGAFAAVADDPSATYYNPAGLGIVDDASLSASLTLTAFDRLDIDRGYRTSRASASLSHAQGTSLPTFVSAVKRLGKRDAQGNRRHALALSTFTVAQRHLSFDVEALTEDRSALETLTVDMQERTVWTGGAYGVAVTPRLSLGISSFLSVQRTRYDEERISAQLGAVNPDDGSYASSATTWTHHLVSTNVKTLVARLGVLYAWSERLRLGLMFQPPSIHLHGTARVRERTSRTDLNASPATGSLFDATEGGLRSRSPIPWELRVGACYQLYDWLRLAGDTSLYGANGSRAHPVVAVGPRKPDSETGAVPDAGAFIAETWHRTMSADVAFGAEALLKGKFTVRAGLYTDFSSSPAVPRSTTVYRTPDVHRFGASASVGLLEERADISLGMIGVFGTGHALSYSPDASTYQRTRAHERMFLIFINGMRSAVNALAKRANEQLQKARQSKPENAEREPAARAEPAAPH